MIGAIIGDIVGSRFEFDNYRSKDFEFLNLECFATDDSIMTLAVGKAIMDWKNGKEKEPLGKLVVKHMQSLGQIHSGGGYGSMFEKWLHNPNPQPYNSFGNGAAMRVSPCGLIATSEEEAKMLSTGVTEVTHNHPEGLKGAEALTIAIYMARNGSSKDDIRQRIETDYYSLAFTLDEIRDSYDFDETCQGTVPQAIVAFLESVSFEDAIRNGISIGGDSDTIGAITGALAEAYYGVSPALKKEALGYLENDLYAIFKEWEQFCSVE
ncbi:MAG: ADP-ribosylglycohydrolase family protein [Brevinema sp.]